MTRMSFVNSGIVVGVLALMASAVVANGEAGNAELRLVEGARSMVDAVAPAAPARLVVLNEGAPLATSTVD